MMVSVLIPCFNSGRFLESAVDSVLAQSHADWEIIVVDDGSDEPATLEILGRLSHPRSRVVHQPNQGPASARNRGVREAAGDYLQFLDADDLLEPSKLESQVTILDADPTVDVAVCDYFFTDAEGTERRSHDGSRTQIIEPALEDVLFRWERGLSIPIHCALFRSAALAGNEPFVERMHSHEDWVFWATLVLAGRRFAYQQDSLALYRRHPKARCNSTADQMVAMADAALYLSELIPNSLRERFHRETIRHLRANYAAMINDPRVGMPLRHRLADDLYAAVRRIPFMDHLTRRAKRLVSGRS